jgi:hypothetical protein
VFTNGTFSVTVNENTGHDYIIQASTDLVDWSSVFTNPMPTPPFTWSDPGASSTAGDFIASNWGRERALWMMGGT